MRPRSSLDSESCRENVLAGLSPAEIRAYRLADNRIALDSTWDEELLALEFEALAVEGLDLEFTGFDAAEIDLVIDAEHGESGPRRRCGQRR